MSCSRFDPEPLRLMLTPPLDDLSMPVAVFDLEGRYLDVNRRLCEIIETRRDKIIGASARLLAPDFAPAVQRCIDTVLREKTVLRQQALSGRLRHTPERLRTWLADFSPWPDAHGEPTQVLMVAQEVTDQVSRERALSDSLAHVRRVLDSLFAFVGVLTPDGTLIEANRAPLQAAGIDWGDVHGKPFWDCKWWAYDTAAQALCRDSVERAAAGETVRFDVPVMMADGQLMDIDYMIAPMRDEDGHITHLIPSGNDITARVRTERGLLRSERRFRELFETVPSGLSVVDEGGFVVEVNTAMEQLSGHSREEMIGQRVEMLVPDQHLDGHTQKVQSYWGQSDARPNIERVLAIKRRDGTVVPVEAALTRVPSEHGRQVLVALTDCSQREAAKAQLEGALREKTGLLNEVHHRVKNNLQVVSSLLSLQLRTAPDEVRLALSAAQGRVKAMALIHQLLYEGKDYAHIDLGLYIGRLVRLLRESLLATNAGITLQVRTPDARVELDLQRAVPCGLLINELVTNALKHAFPAGRSGVVAIELTLPPEGAPGRVRLTVRDDGIGLPAGLQLDGRCTSLGLQMVPLLAEQLEASLQVERQPGSVFQLDFAAQVAT